MTFRVGQKVVCVDSGRLDEREWLNDAPIEGAVYTIVGMVENCDPFGLGWHTSLQLAEIKNSSAWQYAFAAIRFRPIVERKADISIFTAMLKPSRVDA